MTAVFFIVRVLPGDPARLIAGIQASPSVVAHIRQELGINQPIWVQYGQFLSGMLRGDLGESLSLHEPVTAAIGSHLIYTAELAAVAAVLATLVGVALGVLAAIFHDTWIDFIASVVAISGVSMPSYWFAILLILLFAVQLNLLPASGAGGPSAIILPAITLALAVIGVITRMTRASLVEVLGQDYMRTARAKGAGRSRVVFIHGLRNAMLPVVTSLGLQVGALLGGAVLTESVFAWPGVGQLLINSIEARDYPLLEGLVALFAVTYVVINLVVDVVYGYVDPRIRHS